MSVVAMRDISKGEEILVKYGYDLRIAPDWYKQLYYQHQRESWNKNGIYELQYILSLATAFLPKFSLQRKWEKMHQAGATYFDNWIE